MTTAIIDAIAHKMCEVSGDNPKWNVPHAARQATEVLRAAKAAGFELVPMEPTEEMVVAGCRVENFGDQAGRYKAMISAGRVRINP